MHYQILMRFKHCLRGANLTCNARCKLKRPSQLPGINILHCINIQFCIVKGQLQWYTPQVKDAIRPFSLLMNF